MPRTRSQIHTELTDSFTKLGVTRSDSAIRRMAVKWHRRETETGERLEFFAGCRILGITTDLTPQEALGNLEAIAA